MGRRGRSRKSLCNAMSDLELSPEEEETEVLTSLNSDLNDFIQKGDQRGRQRCHHLLILLGMCSMSSTLPKRRLLALTTGGVKASQIVKESFTVISRALTRNSDWWTKAQILDCLAMITFVGGGYDREETGKAMKLIWQFIRPESGSNVVASPALTARAISAWSFVLTSMAGWTLIDSKTWLESATHFSSLLEAKDRSIRMAAGDALALLFEIEDSETFEVIDNEDSESFEVVENEDSEDFSRNAIEALKQKVFLQVAALSVGADGRDVSKGTARLL